MHFIIHTQGGQLYVKPFALLGEFKLRLFYHRVFNYPSILEIWASWRRPTGNNTWKLKRKNQREFAREKRHRKVLKPRKSKWHFMNLSIKCRTRDSKSSKSAWPDISQSQCDHSRQSKIHHLLILFTSWIQNSRFHRAATWWEWLIRPQAPVEKKQKIFSRICHLSRLQQMYGRRNATATWVL